MSDSSHPIKSNEPTPEQLLKLLDLQIEAQRARRRERPRHRGATLGLALLMIVFAIAAALLFLQQTVAELPRSGQRAAHPPVPPDSQ